MAFPTAVNDQITDSVTQANVKVLGEAPAQAMASVYQTAAHSLGLAMENLVSNQQNANNVAQAVVTRCVSSLLGASLPKE